MVPAGTPNLPVGLQRPIPSAGSYYIDSFVWGQQIVLRPNLHYKGARPQRLDGLILGSGITPGAAGARVESGAADYSADPDAPPAPDFARGGRYERRFGSRGARLRYVRPPSGVTSLLLFTTRARHLPQP